MDTVYPAGASALARGRRLRLRSAEPRHRHRTTPVTFAEIKEVDEETCEVEASAERSGAERSGAAGPRRRPDLLEERLGPQFAEFRRRRAHRRDVLRERELESPPPAPGAGLASPGVGLASPDAGLASSGAGHALARAGSEPNALHHREPAADT